MTRAVKLLDARGLFCPEPVMLLHKEIDQMREGDAIRILATDPSTVRDFTRFCAFLGHQLLVQEEVDGEFQFEICKGADEEEE
ncbi:MAG: sulfurtransferase TusA [Oleibacter sp.]|nr:sulfurtransferase TusA [Thalassolituus sp.]